MKLKALLLGSAAAMMSVAGVSTSAIAADAVIAEPHPVEYVRVCDMYGAKWFYMPGTETCIQFDGYVRVTYGYNDWDGRPVSGVNASTLGGGIAQPGEVRPTQASNAGFGYRARLNVRTKNETDYGTLEGWIRLQGTIGQGVTDANVSVDRALISLAGFRLGYSDAYSTTHHGYGFYSDVQDGLYDYHQATFFDYTYSANGFSATAGVQQSNGSLGGGTFHGGGATFSHDARSLDYYAGVGYTGSWGGVAASVEYDNEASEAAYKLSADLNLIEGLSVRGWYMWDDGGSKYVTGSYGAFGGVTNVGSTTILYGGSRAYDAQWGIAMQYKFNDVWAFRAGYTKAEASTQDLFGRNGAGLETLGADGFRDAADFDYIHVGLDIRPVPGLIIRPEVAFDDGGEQYSVRVYRTF